MYVYITVLVPVHICIYNSIISVHMYVYITVLVPVHIWVYITVLYQYICVYITVLYQYICVYITVFPYILKCIMVTFSSDIFPLIKKSSSSLFNEDSTSCILMVI